ncbi:MAG: hypothetical protein ACLTQI_03545 [Slackia sp.]
MRIIRYLKGHIGALVLIIALLVVQAFADLSLPRYTSDLVDVGIQQGGIDRPSPSSSRTRSKPFACSLRLTKRTSYVLPTTRCRTAHTLSTRRAGQSGRA